MVPTKKPHHTMPFGCLLWLLGPWICHFAFVGAEQVQCGFGTFLALRPKEFMALINYITQINLDFGVLALLRAECERVGMRKPLIVTDAGVRAAGLLDRALAALGEIPTRCLTKRRPTPPRRRCAPPWRSWRPTAATG